MRPGARVLGGGGRIEEGVEKIARIRPMIIKCNTKYLVPNSVK
jgi:hypothetical protein